MIFMYESLILIMAQTCYFFFKPLICRQTWAKASMAMKRKVMSAARALLLFLYFVSVGAVDL